jgi:hypothetical protein
MGGLMIEIEDQNDQRLKRAEREAINHMPVLMAKQLELRKHGFRVSAVIIPERLHYVYVGEDADPRFEGSFMGLPIIYSKNRWGLAIVTEEEPK